MRVLRGPATVSEERLFRIAMIIHWELPGRREAVSIRKPGDLRREVWNARTNGALESAMRKNSKYGLRS